MYRTFNKVEYLSLIHISLKYEQKYENLWPLNFQIFEFYVFFLSKYVVLYSDGQNVDFYIKICILLELIITNTRHRKSITLRENENILFL